jgi:hypothetical protein
MHLRGDDRGLLELLQSTTGLGAVYDHVPSKPLNRSSSWVVSAASELDRLLDLLRRAQLHGRKRDEMEAWSLAVDEIARAKRVAARPREALVRLSASRLGALREYRAPTRPPLQLPSRDLRAESIRALTAWSAESDGPLSCTGYSAWRRGCPRHPPRNAIAKTFGTCHAAMQAAGLAGRMAGSARPSGNDEARRARWHAQRRRVIDTVWRFEAEHGRWPRAMEFFKWRLAVMPDSPSQATVYNLFPGGWKSVLEACAAA